MSFVERVNQADMWLLDIVFQPVADRLPERLPAFDLGLSLQLGAVLFFLVAIAIASFCGYASISDSVFNFLNWMVFTVIFISISRMRPLVRSGQANPLRSFLLGLRPVNVVFLGVALWGGISGSGPLMLVSFFVTLSNVIFMLGLYFVSCQPRPPMRRVGKSTAGKSRVKLTSIAGGFRG